MVGIGQGWDVLDLETSIGIGIGILRVRVVGAVGIVFWDAAVSVGSVPDGIESLDACTPR